MLTLFTTLKPFSDPFIAMIQRNAIQSWLALRPHCQIILLGNDKGVKEVAKEFDLLHIPKVTVNEKGLPLVASLFHEAKRKASFPYVCYLNGDIILMNDFLRAIKIITLQKNHFLAVGRRWDVEIKRPLSFNKGWQKKLLNAVKKEGMLHGYSGIDFFVFAKDMFSDIPYLVVGRGGWDNWMIYHARKNRIPVIDITNAATIVHQEHDAPGTREKAKRFTDEYAKQNVAYAGGQENLLTIRDADWMLDTTSLKRIPLSFLSLFYPWRFLLGIKRNLYQLWKR